MSDPMMPSLSLEQVEPLLASPLSESQRPRAEALVEAFVTLLQARYGDRLTDSWDRLHGFVAALVAAGVSRKLAKVNELASQETAGPFSVSWSKASTDGAWFLPGELGQLDSLLGKGGTRSVRTPAPDAVRRLNRLSERDLLGKPVTLAGYPVEDGHVYEW